MAIKFGIVGLPNSGKSFSRRTILDGENTFLLKPSEKASNLKTTNGIALKDFEIQTANHKNVKELLAKMNTNNLVNVVKEWNKKLPPGSFKKENILGNMVLIDKIEDLEVWTDFISIHMPWVHTAFIPDFTHSISKVISDSAFIDRKHGGEAYQRFWELAASALRSFIIKIDSLRKDLIVVNEYHAEFNDNIGGMDVFVPAGKMLQEKFLIPSYYDIMLFTDVRTINEGQDNEKTEYRFVTRPTKRYPYARCMDIFEETYIPNDLQAVLTKIREHLQIPINNGTK